MTVPSFRSVLSWLDDHLLLILAGFLLAFIPLYPKLPLFDVLPGYIVRVRIEDILILITALVWVVQVVRQKVVWKSPVLWAMVAYAVAGLLSVISAVLITKTVPAEVLHIGKTTLHYFRYLEYFSLFAILYSAIQTKKQVKVLLAVIALTVLVLTIYGYGQKYFYWPVYSTMNREFSKGLRLYLTEHARVQSTFGGHYDLAAYLVIVLPLLLALAFNVKRPLTKIALHIIHWTGVWLIIVSGSRSSFVGYVVGVGLVIALTALNKQTWMKRITWGAVHSVVIFGLMGFMLLRFGDEMYERFIQVLQGYPQVYAQYASVEKQANIFVKETVPIALGLKEMPKIIPPAEVPKNAISTDEALALEGGNALVSSDERPVTQRPADVYVDVPDLVEVATISASGEATTILVDRGPREFSTCAQQKGLSQCIRYETLWPRAIAGFKRNPLFGSGYATLTKEDVGQFTEAESTDNNFLRTLGETGLFGFITFYGTMALALWLIIRQVFDKDATSRALSVGLLAGTVGLLINAFYIDVFAASKVALTYWAVSGLILAYTRINRSDANSSTKSSVTSDIPQTNTTPTRTTKSKKRKKV